MSHATSLEQIEVTNLPTPRHAAIQLIQACTRPEVSTRELTELAERDAALTVELLRIVNTPFFGLGREVKSVGRAVTILGHRALRNTALCLAVRDALQPDAIPGLDTTRHWEEVLRRAVSARLLANEVGADAEECFTLGLLQDCGLMILLLNQPLPEESLRTLVQADPGQRLRLEKEYFDLTHDAVAEYACRQWGLPEEIGHVLGRHHEAESSDSAGDQPLQSRILLGADWLAAVFSAAEKSQLIDRCRTLLNERFRLEAETTDQLLAAIPKQVEAAASALQLPVGAQSDFQEILRDANLRLSEENLSYQELTWRLENTLRERDRLAAELNREIELAREIQQSLLPAPLEEAVIAGVNVPARALSGDFYDFFPLPDGTYLFNLGDVSGKGVNAALLMAKTTSLFRCLGKRSADPAGLLNQINDEICETTVRGMFVTMVAGLYDPQHDTVRLANAGHPPALLFRQGQLVQSYGAQAPPLGVMPRQRFIATDIRLGGGDLFVFSDGLTEAPSAGSGPLGIKGLVAMIAASAGQTARERLDRIIAQLRSDPDTLHDDMTILTVSAPDAA
ncbi:MAG: hypothetical protein Kow006_30000 [Gammaproteobacteria bacterium]